MLKDRYLQNKDLAVDIIIPILNTNKYWRENLTNIYEMIPVNELLIGDGGCTDDSLIILKDFPRVKVFDHKQYNSQGKSIVELIKSVNSEYFIYLHADVQLPKEWFDIMYDNKDKYDWFECHRKFHIDFTFFTEQHKHERAYSGSQFGKSSVLKSSIQSVEDDFLQRNEDIIIADLVKEKGKYGKVLDTYHIHQITNKKGELEPKISSVNIQKTSDPSWEKRIWEMQWKGLVKYAQPHDYILNNIYLSILKAKQLKSFKWKDIRIFINVNKSNFSYLKIRIGYKLFVTDNLIKGIAKIILNNTSYFSCFKNKLS